MERLAPVDLEHLTVEQQRIHDEIAAGPRGGVRGPLLYLLHAPMLARPAARFGEELRYRSSFPLSIAEMAMLQVCHHHRCEFAWNAHVPQALRAGLPEDIVEAIRTGQQPRFDEAPEGAESVYHFVAEILRTAHVGDEAYRALEDDFSGKAIVELVAMISYYTLATLLLNVHDHEAGPAGPTH